MESIECGRCSNLPIVGRCWRLASKQEEEPAPELQPEVETLSLLNEANSGGGGGGHGGWLDGVVRRPDGGEHLPPGWQLKTSRSTGKPYYHNTVSKRSQWVYPTTTAAAASLLVPPSPERRPLMASSLGELPANLALDASVSIEEVDTRLELDSNAFRNSGSDAGSLKNEEQPNGRRMMTLEAKPPSPMGPAVPADVAALPRPELPRLISPAAPLTPGLLGGSAAVAGGPVQVDTPTTPSPVVGTSSGGTSSGPPVLLAAPTAVQEALPANASVPLQNLDGESDDNLEPVSSGKSCGTPRSSSSTPRQSLRQSLRQSAAPDEDPDAVLEFDLPDSSGVAEVQAVLDAFPGDAFPSGGGGFGRQALSLQLWDQEDQPAAEPGGGGGGGAVASAPSSGLPTSIPTRPRTVSRMEELKVEAAAAAARGVPVAPSPRARSRRQLSGIYGDRPAVVLSPFCCQECIDAAGPDEVEEEVSVKTDIRRLVMADKGHEALLVLSQAWWTSETEYNEKGQLAGEAELLQSLALHGLASLATSAEPACKLVAEGALSILVGLLDPDGPPPRPSLPVLRSAARALANISCAARPGTWQGEAIGLEVFSVGLLQPLLKLAAHADLQVVRHVSRTLAKLAQVCVLASENTCSSVRTPVSHLLPSGSQKSSFRTLGSSGGSRSASVSYRSHGSSSFQSLASPMSGHRGSRGFWSWFAGGAKPAVAPSSRGAGGTSSKPMPSADPDVVLPNLCQGTDSIGWLCELCFKPASSRPGSQPDTVVQRHAAHVFARLAASACRWLAAADGSDGVVDCLARLAEGTDPMTRHHARFSLAAISKTSGFRQRMAATPSFTDLLNKAANRQLHNDKPTPAVPASGDRAAAVSLAERTSSSRKTAINPLEEARCIAIIARHLCDDTEARAACVAAGVDFISLALHLARLHDQDVGLLSHLSCVLRDCTTGLEAAAAFLEHPLAEEALERLLNMAAAAEPGQLANAALALAQLSLLPAAQSTLRARGALTALIKAARTADQWGDDEPSGSSVRSSVFDAIERLHELPGGSESELGRTDSLDSSVAELRSNKLGQAAGSGGDRGGGGSPGASHMAAMDAAATRKLRSKNVQMIDGDDESELEIEGRISSGQFGDVFKGRWRGSEVAIKCIKCGDHGETKRLIDDFTNEVELMATLRHPHICLFMAAVVKFPKLCIVTELCHRGSLYHILHAKRDKPLPWSRRVRMTAEAAQAIQFLHSHRPIIAHLDLKSPNLLVDKDWRCKLCDFGLARTKKEFYLSLGCGGVGTPEWTAPEVLKGEAFNEQADVYSFGVIMWEMCTRKKPWQGLMQVQVVVAVGMKGERLPKVTDRQVLEAGGGESFVKLHEACLAHPMHDRPSMREVADSLLGIEKEMRRAAAARDCSVPSEWQQHRAR